MTAANWAIEKRGTASSSYDQYTVLVLRMAHRIWKETKQPPVTPGPGNMLGCCLNSFHFLWAILSTSTVDIYTNINSDLQLNAVS